MAGTASPTQLGRHRDEGCGNTLASIPPRQRLHIFDCAVESATKWTPFTTLNVVEGSLPLVAFAALPQQFCGASPAGYG